MESFLASAAKEIASKNKDYLKLVLVLPGKRSGSFLQKELLSLVDKTTFAPKIVSIEDFVQELANIKLAPNLQLLFEFYEAYKEITPADKLESFHSFSTWAQTLLQDFNEIDRYLIPPKQIFSYLFSIKDMDHWTHDNNKTKLQKNYLSFWKNLEAYYENFCQRLLKKRIGYQGLIYREAIDAIEFYLQNNQKHHFFIGFNALNTAEEKLIQEFLQHGNASIKWDIDNHFLKDYGHDAGLFMRRYLKEWKFFNKNPFSKISDFYTSEKNIQIVGVPKNVSQAKYVGDIIQTQPINLESTAIVLGNESILNPLLNSIPKNVNKVNITCGFKLTDTPLASFFFSLFTLIENNKKEQWYYKNIESLLSHPIASQLLTHKHINYSKKAIEYIQKQNIIHISKNKLKTIFPVELHPEIDLIFINPSKTSIEDIISNIISLILCIKGKTSDKLTLEYLFRFYEVFNQLLQLNKIYGSINDIYSLKDIYNELLTKESVDFKGEPMEGLQIMGVLESRNLDFETVIITSVNEGIFPAGKNMNSFLPFDLKINYGLPTHKEKDAIYTYHFYRLLQRAQNIYLIYNTEPDVLEGGEKSRFIRQITFQNLPNHNIIEKIAAPEVVFDPKTFIEINKTPKLIEQLQEIANKGLSPTLLTNYIRNPIDFYSKSVLGIEEVEEVEESIAANTLGSVIHNSLEEFYLPLKGDLLKANNIEQMKPRVAHTVLSHFKILYKEGNLSKGKNLIAVQVAIRYIENFLDYELNRIKSGKKIKIIDIESSVKAKLDIPELSFPVYLKGKIDRVEEVDGVIHIIDYKTGKVNPSDVEIVDWEDLTLDYKYSKAFQVLCYAYILNCNHSYSQLLEAGIISFKNLQQGFMKFATKETSRSRTKNTLITPETFSSYSKELKKLILEIFELETPFREKEIKTYSY